MVKYSYFCDICGKEFDKPPDNKTHAFEEQCDYFHTPRIGFILSLDVCRKCQSTIQGVIDRLSGADIKR